MPVGTRQHAILDAIIRHYIQTARPVSSNDIVDELELAISPATIRHEMLELDAMGFLDQPHTSAGRIPTDRGYRYFVDRLDVEEFLNVRERTRISDVFALHQENEFVRELAHVISGVSGSYTAAGVYDDDKFYSTGLSHVFDEPEFENIEYVKTFGRFAEILTEEISDLARDMRELLTAEDMKIFIGRENPLKCARSYTMIISSWSHPEGFEGFFTIATPTRTNYPKHKAMINNIKYLKSHIL